MASLFWKHVLCVSDGIPAVHVVFDRYLVNRIKSQTREKPGNDVSRLTSVHIQGEIFQIGIILSSMAASKQNSQSFIPYI